MAQIARRDQDIASAPRPSRPIDLVHLAKQCLGDENLELEILRLFDTTLVTYMGRLRRHGDGRSRHGHAPSRAPPVG